MTGREFFDANRDNDDKCKLLQQMEEQTLAEWEAAAVSEFSPGAVIDGEVLYFHVLDPTQIVPGGDGLKSAAFDVCSSHGLSTNRHMHASIAEIIAMGTARANGFNEKFPEKPQRSLWGFVPFNVAEVRSIICSQAGTRGLFVFDTADEDNRSHAEVCQGGKNSKGKGQARSIRTSLYLLAKQRLISLDDMTNCH